MVAGASLKLTRLTVRGFRAFGNLVELAGVSDLNLVAGPNNVGKSSLLMPLRWLTRMDERFVPRVGGRDGIGLTAGWHTARSRRGDARDGEDPPQVALTLTVPPPDQLWRDFLTNFRESFDRPSQGDQLEIVVTWPSRHDVELGIDFGQASKDLLEEAYRALPLQVRRANPSPTPHDLQHLAVDLTTAFAKRVIYVPHARSTTFSLEEPDESSHQERRYDGTSLLSDLLNWYLPTETGAARTDSIEKLNDHVSHILGVPARIWPTADRGIRISVASEPARPLQDLGAGVMQVVTVAAAAVRMPSSPLLLLEEPETCLHPGLQRQLVDHLVAQRYQTFITTHSNHLIDSVWRRGSLYLVSSDAPTGARRVRRVETDMLMMLHDLGVTASSIAAARAVVWVEGPSDAIYLRHWLSRLSGDMDLVEGQDFTFAFHGGALLAHVGLGDQIVNPLDAHPGFYFVADSDRSAAGSPPKHEYLQRLAERCEMQNRIWVTEPKEIEGYVSDACLAGETPDSPSSRYQPLRDRLTALGMSASWAKRKVELARAAVGRLTLCSDESVFEAGSDLREQISKLARFLVSCRERLPYVAR
jgi:predicted ATP-dependent endonuclease of OLD family